MVSTARQEDGKPRRKRVKIFDTTLRDGEQAPGNVMTIDDKVELFAALDKLGLDMIESGFPASSAEDYEAFRQMVSTPHETRICAFARATRRDIDVVAEGFGDAEKGQVEILLVGSEIHLEHKRRITADQAVEEAVTSVRHAVELGFTDIAVAPEDCTRGSLPYLERLLKESVAAGARTIAIPDTVGCALPHEFARMVRTMRGWVGDEVDLSAHCHNDLGLALANTLAAIEAGVDYFQATLCGIGERAGNTALEEAVAQLALHGERLGTDCVVDTEGLFDACARLREIVGLEISPHKPLIGSNAFARPAHGGGETWKGDDAGGLPDVPNYVEPVRFGRGFDRPLDRARVRTTITHRLSRAGLCLIPDVVDAVNAAVRDDPRPERFNDSRELVALYSDLEREYRARPRV